MNQSQNLNLHQKFKEYVFQGEIIQDRQGYSISYDNIKNRIFIFGGETSKLKFTNDFYQYCLETNTVTKILGKHPLGKKVFEPPAMAYHQSWIYDKYFCVFGGQTKEKVCNSTVYAFHLEYMQWFKLFQLSPPSPRINFSICELST